MINSIIGNYKVTRLIGKGGMASVYEAEHKLLGNKVAIKVLNPILSADNQIKERFKNEAVLMASLDHPNITKVIDFDEQPHQLSIVMEYLNGEDLNQKIKKNGPLTNNEVHTIFTQTLSALQYAHEKGIVHRDIKPSNIFVLPDGSIKILDFGIAKLFGQGNEMTHTGTQMGTPIYMSPEQVKADKSIDHRSDIYSIGVTIFYAINGKPPYDADTASQFDIFNKIVFEPLPEIPNLTLLNNIIRKACEKNREHRFETCEEFLKEIQAVVDNNLQNQENNASLSEYKEGFTSKSNASKSDDSDSIEAPSQNLKTNKKRNRILIAIGGLLILVALFFFLKQKDSDNDGVIDKYDECPYEPGSVNGCPDSDGDGIIDKHDECPYEPGSVNGCPDSDGDGVIDKHDECPYEPGSVNGCPDSDGDGIPDFLDLCPDVPKNNDDGCFYYEQITFINESEEITYLCIAYFYENAWQVEGHFGVPKGQKFIFPLPKQFKENAIYWYGSYGNYGEWKGTDQYFYIDRIYAFKNKDGKFIKGGSDPVRKGFVKLSLSDVNSTIRLID